MLSSLTQGYLGVQVREEPQFLDKGKTMAAEGRW